MSGLKQSRASETQEPEPCAGVGRELLEEPLPCCTATMETPIDTFQWQSCKPGGANVYRSYAIYQPTSLHGC